MRHIPEAGAVCGNSARTDLCGGRGVTSVPTATLNSTLPSTFSVIGESWLNEINELRWFLC